MKKVKSSFLATSEKFVPIAAKHRAQTNQRGQTRKIFSGFDILDVADTDANFFG